ncbi:ketimine reductase mu-crystallin-like isoform X2 [Ptychodera flava]|uniref:ketimine reductase mu-crystallin-like isoform X2 n=1 Tax=Ptychodera flava TaxID=63121 RepID=UPI003969DA42
MAAKMTNLPKYITMESVRQVLKMADLIPVIEKAMGDFSKGEEGGVVQPVRTVVPVKEHNGVLFVMPGYSTTSGALVTKLVTRFRDRDKTCVAGPRSTVCYFDHTNGDLKSIMDGEVITSMRTAAASAVATKYLASKESKILCILGAGEQAGSHYQALHQICNFQEVRVWSRTISRAQKFAAEYKSTVCETAEEAAKDADVIVTVTMSTKPILEHSWVKPGAHVNCVGACRPDWQELSSELMQKSVVYVDSREAAMKESGDVLISKAEVYAEIGDLVNGTKEASRDKTTVFKSLGMAVEDVVSAKLVYDKYVQQNGE